MVTGADDDELVANAEQHMREIHRDLAGTLSREQVLAMATDQ